MRKVIFFTTLLITQILLAQTQRFVIFEEFTQASCGPCASQNPAFNALLQSNDTKTFGLKYQTAWPGTDPMNEHNPDQVQERVNYYEVTGVPYCRMDGSTEPVDPGGQVYDGAPANVDQAMIDTRYNTPSPFSVTLSHTVNNNLDSITIDVTVKNESGSTFTSGKAGSLKLHVVIAEEEIVFSTAPGTNGEKDFYGVMKSMVTGGTGFTLADSWTSGQTYSNTYKVQLPLTTYDAAEIMAVAFVQEDDTKEILNGAVTSPQAVPMGTIDIKLSDMSPNVDYCATQFTPNVEIMNNSSTAVTTLDLWYTVNGGSAVKSTWTGNLGTGQKVTHNMSPITLTGGLTEIIIYSTRPNNGADQYLENNFFTISLQTISQTPNAAPFNYTFEGYDWQQLPTNMIFELDNPGRVTGIHQKDVDGLNWNLGAFEGSENSILFNLYNIPSGDVNSFVTEKASLSGISNSKLYFDHAYAQWSNENDMLQVFISDDCGANWDKIFEDSGANLATSPPVGGNDWFFPKAEHWERHSLDISTYDGKEVIAKFIVTSDYGNNLYIDNVLFNDAELSKVSIEENFANTFNVYPNPASEFVNIELNFDTKGKVSITIFNELGQVVMTSESDSNETLSLDVSSLANGMYTVNVTNKNNTMQKRISVVR